MNGDDVLALIDAWAAAVDRHRERLGELDAAVGDGDHGAALARGFARAAERRRLDPVDTAAPGPVLARAGKDVMAHVGGASGALFGSVLGELGAAAGEAPFLTREVVADGLRRAVARVGRLGRSAPGDKTMLDALAPAADALSTADGDLAAALAVAAAAARVGAEATRSLPARHGRARYTPDAGVGHQDPGATSIALLLETWAEVAAKAGRGEAA